MDSKKYNNIKLAFGISKTIVTFILLFVFVYYDFSKYLVNYLSTYVTNSYIILFIFVVILGIILSILFFPANFYTEFLLEHKYNLSNQTFFTWIWENFKSTMVGSIIGIPILMIFYYIMENYGNLWWLPFAFLLFIVTVILSKVLPIIILPIFYKLTPIEDEDLKQRILVLSDSVNMKIDNVFQFNLSKNTKKANAAFTGLGKTKKILLGDTLTNEFSNDEIETVIAHELGHYKHKHLITNIVVSTVSSFLTFYLLSVLYQFSIGWLGFKEITEIAALPLLVLWGMLIGLIQTPLLNILSRKHEYQADEYAVKTTNKKDIFIDTLTKLTEKNMGDKEPHPFVEWFFYSHPSIKKRVAYIKDITLKKE